MKNKKLKIVAAATAAIMVLGSASVLAACSSDNDESEGEVYTRVVNSLLDMEDCPFIVMTSGLDGTAGIMPYDSWGSAKFTTIKHTFTLQIGTVGFADEEDVDIHIAMNSDGTVSFASGDSATALAYTNLAAGTISSGFGDSATTSSVADTIHACNYMFKLETYLVGNNLSDGYTGSGYACYVWYGVVGDMLVGEDDGLNAGEKAYSLPVSTYSEYYVEGTLSHGGSTTSIVPDAGFYINSLMDQSQEPYTYAEHHGGTDSTLVYVTPKVLGMQYFKSGYVYIDTDTMKITKFNASYYSAPVTSSLLTLYDESNTKLGDSDGEGITVNLKVGESVTLTVDAGSSLLSSLLIFNSVDEAEAAPGSDQYDNDALSVTKSSTSGSTQDFTLEAVSEGEVTLVIANDRGTIMTLVLNVVITADE